MVPAHSENDGEITVELEQDEINSIQLAKSSLVWKILSPKPLNKWVAKSILIKAWGDPKHIQIEDMGVNVFLFTFSTRGKLLIFSKEGLGMSWLHGFPLDMLTTMNAAKIMGRVGETMEVESPYIGSKLVRTFIRVRALIDITKPLSTGCWVPRKDLPKTWIIFRYEKLQGLCFNCGIIDHEQKDCREDKVMAAFNPQVPKYSSKLGVPPAKAITMLMQEHKVGPSPKPAFMAESNNSQQRVRERSSVQNEEMSVEGASIQQPGAHIGGSIPGILQETGDIGYFDKSGVDNVLNLLAKEKRYLCPTAGARLVDLEENKRRAGLGPQDLHTLGIGFSLNPMEISKVRNACRTTTKEEGPRYIVKFPDEVEGNENFNHPIPVLQAEEEKQLILGWNQALSLKRRREEGDNFEEIQQHPLQVEGGKRIKGGSNHAPNPAMSWISWNCRGIAAASTNNELMELCKRFQLSLLFLLETRAKEEKVEKMRMRLRFKFSYRVPPVGLSGGLCLLWNNSLEVDVDSSCQNFIHAFIEDKIELDQNRPWCCLGDFNEIVSQAEKEGMHPQNRNKMDLFRDFMDKTGLMYMELKWCKFMCYGNSFYILKPFTNYLLAHSPTSSGSSFKYEAKWEEHEQYAEVVKDDYTGEIEDDDKWKNFLKRAKRCRITKVA
ncbi:Zinc finger, CCHC-type [Sesbania bispinosa]|nr:Zinc finger, CCHC-type [Sesbania bispinosa]